MQQIGKPRLITYLDGYRTPVGAYSSNAVRRGSGFRVETFFDLAKKVADLHFRNPSHVFLFRGQRCDHTSSQGSSTLKASLFRLEKGRLPSPSVLQARFATLRQAEAELLTLYGGKGALGKDRLKRHRVLRWAILQHYEVCPTPLLDVTQSLRNAASFATLENESREAFVYVIGVPYLSGAITASSEAGVQIVRLSSACPPTAVRPHLQEGYLLGEYPEIADYEQHARYSYFEMDFGRRLVGKFRFDPTKFWLGNNFTPAPRDALFPSEQRDGLIGLIDKLKERIECNKGP